MEGDMPGGSYLFGELAVVEGYIKQDELMNCLDVQIAAKKDLDKHFLIGDILYLRGHINASQHHRLVRLSEVAADKRHEISSPPPLFGQVVLKRGYAKIEQLLECLEIQQKEDLEGLPHRRIGDIMRERGYLTPLQHKMAVEITQKLSEKLAERGRSRLHSDSKDPSRRT